MPYGDTPYVKRGGQTDYKGIMHSEPHLALRKSVSLCAGYGLIEAGTPLAKVTGDGPSKDSYVPYNPTTPSSAIKQPGRAFLVQDTAANTFLYVTMDDSYKFQVGDQVYVSDANTTTSSATDCGVITAIDRTTYTHMAKITVTTTLATDFTVAQSACVFLEAGASNANTWSDCAGILELAVNTGVGEHAKGGIGTMLISNCILYNGMLPLVDSACETDLGATVDGQFLIMK
jgi:hypothetical protein